MLGRRDRRVRFADVDGWEQKIPTDPRHAQIRCWIPEHYQDENFPDWFGSNWTPIETAHREARSHATSSPRIQFLQGISLRPRRGRQFPV